MIRFLVFHVTVLYSIEVWGISRLRKQSHNRAKQEKGIGKRCDMLTLVACHMKQEEKKQNSHNQILNK